MNQILHLVKPKLQESVAAVLPITLIVLALSIILVPLETGTIMMFMVGAVLLVFGMGMFQLGAETAMEPMGQGIGIEMSKAGRTVIAVIVTLALGVIITIAEPDLQVLANQVPAVPNMTLILTVAVGVGVFLAMAVLRIVFKIDLSILLMVLYAGLMVLAFVVPRDFIAVAFDSGGVTTGPITVPFIMAMGVGLSAIRGDKDAANDSFGLVALSSVGPILAVAVLGCFFRPEDAVVSETVINEVVTMRDVFHCFAVQIPHYAKEVFISIIPIIGVYFVFQLVFRRFHRRQKVRMLVGFTYTYIGLVLFLCGVNVGFAPVGALLGNEMAGTGSKWLLVPIGALIGYFIVKAEPAIQVLNHQVQNVTNGAISARSMNSALSIGVSISVGLAMLRIILQIPILYILIPGYVIALVMSRLVPKIFVGIAFDSGGVASGPMTSTFLLPICIGTCQTMGGNVMTDAFGVVALVALTPLIAIQIMGLRYRYKLHLIEKRKAVIASMLTDGDEIIEIEEY